MSRGSVKTERLELGIGGAHVLMGAHIGYWYRTREEKFEALIGYFEAGIKAGQLCMNILPADDVEGFVEAANGRLGEALREGRLRMATSEEFFFKGSKFHPNKLIRSYPEIVSRAVSEGFSSIRGAGELPLIERRKLSMESFFEYEARVTPDFFERYPAVGLCLFDMERFGLEWTLGILRTHPLMLSHGSLFENPSYRPA